MDIGPAMEPASLPDPAPPERAVRISSHNSQRRYMSYQHTICFPVQAKRQHETHTHTHVHNASDVVSDLTPAFTFSLITSGLFCLCVQVVQRLSVSSGFPNDRSARPGTFWQGNWNMFSVKSINCSN